MAEFRTSEPTPVPVERREGLSCAEVRDRFAEIQAIVAGSQARVARMLDGTQTS